MRCKCMYLTKPKPLTKRCMKWLYQNCTELAIVFCEDVNYDTTGFITYCREHDIKILKHDDIEKYVQINPGWDVILSNLYSKKIENHILKLADKIAMNIHPAPLPEYRGVFGYNFAMLNGATEYGVTAHKLSEQFDKGDIIAVERFTYDCNNGWLDELVPMAEEHMYQLLIKIMTKIINGENLTLTKQGKGNYYSLKDFNNAKRVSFDDNKTDIDKKIRAFWYPPYEGAFIEINGQKYTLVNDAVLHRVQALQ